MREERTLEESGEERLAKQNGAHATSGTGECSTAATSDQPSAIRKAEVRKGKKLRTENRELRTEN
jgi:hypothetical protein